MSAGTVIDRDLKPVGPSIVVRWPSRRTAAPSQPSRRSVWSRVGPGVSIVVRSGRGERRELTAPSTWALATGSRCSMARSGRVAADPHRQVPVRGRDVGAHGSERRRDALHRPPGEARVADQRGGSVRGTAGKGSGEQPGARAGVAAVKRLSAGSGQAATLPCRAATADAEVPDCRAASSAPSVRSAIAVDTTSCARPSSAISASPAAIALKSSARCAIDLSDGSRSSPRSRVAAWTLRPANGPDEFTRQIRQRPWALRLREPRRSPLRVAAPTARLAARP